MNTPPSPAAAEIDRAQRGPIGIAVLGSTGSIGRQALDLAARHPDRMRIVALAARANADLLAEQVLQTGAVYAAIADPGAAPRLRERLDGSGVKWGAGPESLCRAAVFAGVDRVLLALSGFAALGPGLAAAGAGIDLCLANKEALVAAGDLLVDAALRSGAHLLPVDSEHSAMFQCLMGEDPASVERLILTASGGAFRDLPESALASVTPEQALRHPTWRMGAKITVDSATLMNKGLEILEAHRLFGVPIDRIVTVCHAQSIVHSLVEFMDGSTKAQVGPPDMRVPIQFALFYPERIAWDAPRVDWSVPGVWTFEPLDEGRHPCLGLAREAARRGGTAPAVLSAADEVAVEAFLEGRIGFLEIARVVEQTLNTAPPAPLTDLDSLLAADADARQRALEAVARSGHRSAAG